jgi:signal transduction histidine kinase
MEDSSHREELRYRALAEAATAATAGTGIELAAQKGLAAAVEYIHLAAGALILWGDSGEVKVRSIEAVRDDDRRILLETEETLLAMLRKNFQVTAAYMELAGEPARAVFTLPIDVGGRQFGALIGIRLDKVRLHDYDEFLRALAAVLALAAYPGEAGAGATPAEIENRIKTERDTAIIELAVAINHEINNPLTALLGNLQLLMLKNKNLPEDIVDRLKVIEESANQIREVTGRLMKAAEAPSVTYTGSMRMIDLSGRKDAADKGGKPKDKREDDPGP